MERMKDSICFISGGAGTLGQELTKLLLEQEVKEVRVYSRGEIAHVNMKQSIGDDRVKYIIGDVRDYQAVEYAIRGSEYVFALAALKHVGICENQPQEAIKTNVDGLNNMIEAAIKNRDTVRKFVFMSSDKAIYPSNLYGMTKGVGERLTIQANMLTSEIDFTIIRSGNILGSSGSVIPLFINMAKTKNEITLTDGRMTRFFLPARKVANLLVHAAMNGKGGEVFIPAMNAFKMYDIASILMDFNGKDGTIKQVGARPGEKMDEVILSDHELKYSKLVNDWIYVVMPSIETNRDYSDYADFPDADITKISSDDLIESKEFLYQMLYHYKFLV